MPDREYSMQWPDGFSIKDLVGVGISSKVVRLDAVMKFGSPDHDRDIERERQVYERLGNGYPGILRYYGQKDEGILLQYACNNSIRSYFRNHTNHVSLNLRLRWIEQITATVGFIHSKGVLHGDISCNNIFLDHNFDTKVADFAGSSIDGETTLTGYESSHDDPKNHGFVSVRSEIFALGSTFYEIMTGSTPYKELEQDQIGKYYAQHRYPSIATLDACGEVIYSCWTGKVESMETLLRAVKAECKLISGILGMQYQPLTFG